ncbi:BglG family transcription antiterminator [Brachybacterium endophyticum]|uniref:BglG family transcription antiterminator n=1 Tax=Brachybacterium endophyticum TaxID=2182385 RepID=UPI0014041F69|nr:PTS sugar transporter subunit IIA [Brachybacterium endophyticum]
MPVSPSRPKETAIAATRERRERALLDLLRRADGPVPTRRISAALGAAPRTIRDDVARLNAAASQPLILSDGQGYRLAATAPGDPTPPAPREGPSSGPQARLDEVLRTIIGAEWTDVYELAESLHVSDSTLAADLSKARAILRGHDLTFRRRGDLVQIVGGEREKRRLMRSLLFSREDGAPADVLGAVRAEPDGLLGRLHSAVTGPLREQGLELNPYLLADLLLHLVVTVERERAEPSSSAVPEATGTSASAEDPLVARIASGIHEATGVPLPPADHGVLLQALSTGAGHSGERLAQGGADDAFLAEFDRVLEAVSSAFGLRWGADATREALARHTRLMLERARAGRQIESSFGHDFQRSLPMVHEITVHFVHHLEALTGQRFTDGEIELLSLHLGTEFRFQLESGPRVTITLVAPRYGRVTSALADRLAGTLDRSAVIEHREQDAAHLGSITSDLVVSTVPLPELTSAPVIRISPLLTDQDLQAVQRGIHAERNRQRRDRARARLVRLLDPALFLHVDELPSGQDAIRRAAQAMTEQGAVPDTFADDVIERDARSSTAFPGRFAIPHSLHHDAHRTSICVLTTENDIDWSGTPVRLMLLFSIAPDGLEAFREVLDLLIEVLSEAENVLALAERGTDFEAFLARLLRMLD